MKQLESLQIGHSHIKNKDFKIECEVINDKDVEVPFSHRHFFYAIYWVHEGNGIHIIDFEEYEMKPDRIFFIRPEQIHFMHIQENLKYSALQFTEDFMIPVNWIRKRKFRYIKTWIRMRKRVFHFYSIRFRKNLSAICPIQLQ